MSNKEEFYRKRITQTEYRGKYNPSYDKEKNFLDTKLEPVKIKQTHQASLIKKIKQEAEKFFIKIVSEKDVDVILNGKCMKLILKNLGLNNGKSR